MGGANIEFFPLWKAQMEDSESFKQLTPHEKIVYWFLQSQFNLYGPGWYTPDLKLAVATDMSLSKVRQARRMFRERGWVVYDPGFQVDGRNVATKYHRVEWAGTPDKDSGESWVPLHRYTFESMVGRVLRKDLGHADVVAYIVLWYWWRKHIDSASENQWWFISKKDLRTLTGVANVGKCLRNLYSLQPFGDGSRLFEFDDEVRRYTFPEFKLFADPSESEVNFNLRQELWAEIEQRYERKRRMSRERNERKRIHDQVKPEELGEYWKWISGQKVVQQKDVRLLAGWANEFGTKTICTEMDEFLGLSAGRVRLTLVDFKKHWKKMLADDQQRPSWLPRQ